LANALPERVPDTGGFPSADGPERAAPGRVRVPRARSRAALAAAATPARKAAAGKAGTRPAAVRAADATDPDGLPELAGSGFTLIGAARRASLRRTWLDTFDWRLYRAGLTLEQVTGPGTAELRLTGRDGAVVAVEPLPPGPAPLPRWPSLAAALPPGPVAERLAPVTGVRALLPVARAASSVRALRALNSDDKTVARVTADRMSATYPAAAELGVRLTVTAVRGYQPQAARLTGLLTPPGAAVPPPALEAVLAAAGQQAGDYSGRVDVQLSAAAPAANAMAAVFTALLDTLEANVPGTIADIDTEFLHDLRIAVRRTRSALKLAGRVLPGSARQRFRPEFKWLGDLTTPTRDLDVYLLQLPAMTAGLVGADAADLAPLGDHLRRERGRAQRELARGLRSARFRDLRQEWRDVLAQAAASSRRKPAAGPLAARSIAEAHQRVLAGGAAITAASPPGSLHELRKLCKELRYALEIFASLYPPATAWRAVKELKGMQDCLGEFQDTDVQRAELRAFAGQMLEQRKAPAETLLAMGEIAAGLAVAQRRARAEFGGLFAQFASPASQARIRALTGPDAS
jgi:CHAD domain-containing protein